MKIIFSTEKNNYYLHVHLFPKVMEELYFMDYQIGVANETQPHYIHIKWDAPVHIKLVGLGGSGYPKNLGYSDPWI